MSEILPYNWIEVQIEDLINSLESGGRPKGGVKGILEGILSIGGEHLSDNGGFKFDKIRYIPEEYYLRLKKGHIENNDILIVKDGATTSKTSFVNNNLPYEKAVVNEHVFVLKISKEIISKALFYYLWSEEGKRKILKNFQGSAQGGINRQFISNTLIPLIPLNEQKRIVAKLDNIIPRIDAVEGRLDKVSVIIKRFRQSVLTAAVTGTLTEKWRDEHTEVENVENVIESIKQRRLKTCNTVGKKAKIKSILSTAETEDNDSLPETWRFTFLNKICESFQYGTSNKSQKNGKIPVLRMGNLQNGRIDWNNLVYTSDPEEIKKYQLQKRVVVQFSCISFWAYI